MNAALTATLLLIGAHTTNLSDSVHSDTSYREIGSIDTDDEANRVGEAAEIIDLLTSLEPQRLEEKIRVSPLGPRQR